MRARIIQICIALLIFIASNSCQKEISCEGCAIRNSPPKAVSGPNLLIQLPIDSVLLDGRASSDPDGSTLLFEWRKIAGPSAVKIASPGDSITIVRSLIPGIYQFELKVTDDGGLFSKDTVLVSVVAGGIIVACGNSNRPIVEAQLVPVASLPSGSGKEFVVLGNKVYFMTMECPECTGPTKMRAYYNIYDLGTQSWSRSSEFQVTPRNYGAEIIAAGNKIFYAGGSQSNPTGYFAVLSDIEIYDVTSNTWTSAKLSAGGLHIAGAVVGNEVLFAGGLREDPVKLARPSSIVDIYNLTTNTWSVASLSQARADISAVTSNSKIYFAGGSAGLDAIRGILDATNVMDIYDGVTQNWSVSTVAVSRSRFGGIAIGNKLIWAGGLGFMEGWLSIVEIWDIDTQSSFQANLFQEKYWGPGNHGAALAHVNKVVFFTGVAVSDQGYNSCFDIYDVNTNSWSVGKLNVDIGDASIFSYNNNVYVVGGVIGGSESARIRKLVF